MTPADPSQGGRTAARTWNKDPLDAPEFATLRSLRRLLSFGGLPPPSERSPSDDARIAAFFTLQELIHILNEFRRTLLRGTRCRLSVSEDGRSPGKVTIQIAIVEEPPCPSQAGFEVRSSMRR